MTGMSIPTLDEYRQLLARAVAPVSLEEQRVAVTLYRELAQGQPVDAIRLGQALGATSAEVEELLDRDSIRAFVHPDERGRVVGFYGLAATATRHRLEVDGRRLWSWCAWDTLFIPEILDVQTRVESTDPETGQPIQLVVSPERIESAEPAEAVVSFLPPEAGVLGSSAVEAITKFCHYVYFFRSAASGRRWVARHPGTFLYSLGEAFELARWWNAHRFGAELAARRALSA